ncbi:PEP-CTERM sorting domain-containing protein [sulfur-oxidizing endosymbiont of Gigantopelta aegis]|uniref:PEP-CTERM sorting domain-containing protein n=1 Tax=sulfur-oxidizing endosymbiont of Gigantopelta aegis TaxID=2794934 RepID=UPI0018DB310F|nr:PEP-CTERM sorting domain-containing protein [sulfur-oxidizing endosymbiont of Gigantopelta aegis]
MPLKFYFLSTTTLLMLSSFLMTANAAVVVPCSGLNYANNKPTEADGTSCLEMNSSGDAYSALLREGNGASDLAVLFLHGRNKKLAGQAMKNHPNGDVVRQLRTYLNTSLGLTTLSIETPNISNDLNSNNRADFFEYDAAEAIVFDQMQARFNTALDGLKTQGIKRVVVMGFSMGSRYATALTAAADQGVLGNGLDLVGLIGTGMYINSANSTTGPNDIRGFDTLGNLALIDSIPVLDVFGDLDAPAANSATARKTAYAGATGLYSQVSLACPDYVNNAYYTGGGSKTYTKGNCHQLRDAQDANGNTLVDVRGTANSPLTTTVISWFNNTDFDAVKSNVISVPEPSTLVLLLLGVGFLGRKSLQK